MRLMGLRSFCLVLLMRAVLCDGARAFTASRPQSPCPRYFQYQYDGREWSGFVMMPSVPFGTVIKLQMHMSIARALPTKYAGHIELLGPRSEVLQAILQERPIRYRVHFPLSYPLPSLTTIVLNNQILCTGPKAAGPIVTNIALEHTLFPHGHNLNSEAAPQHDDPLQVQPFVLDSLRPNSFTEDNNDDDPDVPQVTTPTSRSQPPPPSSQPTDNAVLYRERYGDVCGTSTGISPLIANGELVIRGSYPWLVAVFAQKSLGLEFTCGATLVSRRHVVTAAHCIQPYGEQAALAAADLVLMLGKYHIRKWTEPDTVVREVSSVQAHPQYKALHADADLAIIVMVQDVEFTRLIRPICLWLRRSDLSELVGQEGTIVGWGRDETGQKVTPEPRQTRVRVVSQETCLRSHSDYRYITSNRTLCAGGQDGAGACSGDSGGGLLVQRDGRWHLRGLISMSLTEKATLSCDLNSYSVFVDMAKFVDWIFQYVS